MRYFVLTLFLLPAFAWSQAREKPLAIPDPHSRRAESIVVEQDSCVAGELKTTRHTVNVGHSDVSVVVHEIPGGTLDALVLHDDENTAVGAALDVICRKGGRLVELVHSGERNVAFEVDGDAFVADPNRMFTDVGRERTLSRLSRDAPQARKALATLADSVRTIYGEPSAVVTLHNNTPDNYSAESYLPDREYADDAEAVFLASSPSRDTDDFYFVTDRRMFEALSERQLNVVLQDNAEATDDGSLSVWAGQNDVPYVNVEAEYGHLDEQVEMIELLLGVLERR